VKKTGVFLHASKMREENSGFSSHIENAWRKLGFFFTQQKCVKKTGIFLHATKMRVENLGFSSGNKNAWTKLGFFFTQRKCVKKTRVLLHASKMREENWVFLHATKMREENWGLFSRKIAWRKTLYPRGLRRFLYSRKASKPQTKFVLFSF
jgi:hypothetical protein